MQLTESQLKAIQKINDLYQKISTQNQNGENKNVYFKAPTGAGKTFIASKLIEQFLVFEKFNKANLNNKTIVIIATVSSANLPEQFAKKLKDYQKYNQFKDYEIEHVQSPSKAKTNKSEDYRGFKLANNKVFVLGTSSFGKNTIFYQNNVLQDLIKECEVNNYNIIFIRDEAHIGSREKISKDDLKRFDACMESNAKFILKMTATPPHSDGFKAHFIEITAHDLNNDTSKLLKHSLIRPRIRGNVNQDPSEEDVLDQAIAKFLEVKSKYQKLECETINPAILIQIDNDSKMNDDKKREFKRCLALIERKLSDNGLVYLKYLDKKEVVGTNCPATLEYASQNNSLLDVIIFKVGPATGWDIPRANMLIQLRNVSSEILNAQTIGRIKRNPFPNLKFNSTTDEYYLYSDYQGSSRELKYYVLKDQFKQGRKTLYTGIIDRNSEDFRFSEAQYIKKVKEFINSKDFEKIIQNLNINEDIVNRYKIINDTTIIQSSIPNYIYLKIDNLKNWANNKSTLCLDHFITNLKELAKRHQINIEIITCLFLKRIESLLKIKNKCSNFDTKIDNYLLKDKAKLASKYEFFANKDNKKNQSDFSAFTNYGYKLITSDPLEKNVQFLDSNPEYRFMERLKKNDFITQNYSKILFYAKMPVFGGSGVYFEYYSKSQGKIAKSYIDFVIELNNKMLMIEVKSFDNDYDVIKTNELKNAYKNYMLQKSSLYKNNGVGEPQIILAIYAYNADINSDYMWYYDLLDKTWRKKVPFREAINKILK